MSQSVEVDPRETVAVYAAPDQMTAELVRGALHAEGIEAVIGEQVTGTYGSAFATGEGSWGEIRVLPEDVDRARIILQAYQDGRGAVSDDELAAEAEAASDPGV